MQRRRELRVWKRERVDVRDDVDLGPRGDVDGEHPVSRGIAPAPDSNACAMWNLGERALDLIDLPGRTERLPDEPSRTGIQGMAWD